jgi:hypothetical protein
MQCNIGFFSPCTPGDWTQVLYMWGKHYHW